MRALLATLAALALICVVGDKPFTYKKDSVMTYTDSRFGPDGSANNFTVTWTVAKVDGDKNYMDVKTNDESAVFLFSYADGYFCWGTVNGDKEDTGLRVLKLDAKKGDKWDPSAAPAQGVTVSYVGDEDVTVPAGKFSCKHVLLDVGGHVKVDFWFAAKVGLVKATRELFLDENTHFPTAKIELQKFVEGK